MLPLLLLLAADFAKDIRPLLESQCIGCHGASKALAGVRLDTAEGAKKASARIAPSMISGAMPPGGPRIEPAKIALVREWVESGAAWPSGLVLGAAKAALKDDLELTRKLHARIKPAGKLEAYKLTIPATDVTFEMVPIPGGEVAVGGVRKQTVEPFWMGAREVTWDEYRLFMFAVETGQQVGADPALDAVSRPTRPYVEMSFGMGINGYPAISMTQHAANKYAQWLSARTGQFYRLPTEAEWEHACRAGSAAPPDPLADYAWFDKNAGGKYALTGKKKPNAWGLYDMLGNVMEWTLDQYAPLTPTAPPGGFVPSKEPYPHVAKGGGWADPASKVTCSVRVGSDPSWKMQDPQLPKSIWYLTDAQWLGFRLVRPQKTPPAEEMHRMWNNGVEVE